MRIGQSRRVLTALANGWFKLTGPPAPDETVVGADDLTDHSDDSSDDGDSPGGDLAVISRPKKPLPHKKAPAAPRKVPSKKTPAAPKQAPIKAAPKRKTAPDAHRRRQSSSESSAVSSSSSDEGESLVGQLARESSSRSSSSDRSSLPSGQVPSRVHSDSDGSSLPSVSFSESASDISEESRPLQQPQRLEGRERRSWTPVPCPEPWGTWHYYWPHELDLEAIEAGRPGPWDNDWVDPTWRNAPRGSTAWALMMTRTQTKGPCKKIPACPMASTLTQQLDLPTTLRSTNSSTSDPNLMRTTETTTMVTTE
ncbi:hypothetical protein KEM48_000739 [Puccinia striiformis f. sp. tritici PST-130]|nr:hypothetical protein KEM48_000739 [Puccinia striiformis f. sp. tritici PST-130]